MKKILVLNSGSSSLKYQLFNVDGDKYDVVAKGKADRIGIHGSFVEIKITNGEKRTREVALPPEVSCPTAWRLPTSIPSATSFCLSGS